MRTESPPADRTGAAAQARRSGAVNMAVKLSGAGLAFALTVLLARTTSAEGFAQVSVALAWVAVLSALGTLSMPLLAVRFVGDYLARGRSDLARGVVVFALAAATLAALAILLLGAALLAIGADTLAPHARAVAWWALLLLVPSILLGVCAGVLQAHARAVTSETLNSVLRPVLVGVAVLLAWAAAGGTLSAATVLCLNVAVSFMLLVVAGWLVFRLDRARLRGVRPAFESRHWFATALGLMAVLLTVALSERLDLLMLGWLAPAEQVAPYAVAQRFAQTVLLAINAIAAVMAPQFVASLPALRAGDPGAGEALAKSGGRLALATCAAAWLVFLLAGPWITLLFGPGYHAAYLPLLVLVGGQVVACLFGPGLLLATLTGHTRVALGSLGCGIAVNAAINWWTVPVWGGLGAACATASGAVVTGALAHRFMTRRLNISLSVFPVHGWRPLPALRRPA